MNEKALLTDEKLSSEKKIINLQKDIEKLNEVCVFIFSFFLSFKIKKTY